MTPDEFAAKYHADLLAWDAQRDRSQQVNMGPSAVGWCRQQAALITKEQAKVDTKNNLPAILGTFIHAGVAEARAMHNPEMLHEVEVRIKIDVPGYGTAEMIGHVDEVDPMENAVTDLKTVDGLAWVRRNGVSQAQRFQRHLYALGALQHGLLDPDRPVIVRNVFIDRSGKEAPHVEQEEMDPTLTDQIGAWLSDVFYAVQHREDAARDIPAPVCEQVCEFFSVCRGALPVEEGGEWIEDADLLTAVDMYIEGQQLEKRAKELRATASAALAGVNGMTPTHQVRWTHVNDTEIAGYTRAGYERLDIRRRKGA